MRQCIWLEIIKWVIVVLYHWLKLYKHIHHYKTFDSSTLLFKIHQSINEPINVYWIDTNRGNMCSKPVQRFVEMIGVDKECKSINISWVWYITCINGYKWVYMYMINIDHVIWTIKMHISYLKCFNATHHFNPSIWGLVINKSLSS